MKAVKKCIWWQVAHRKHTHCKLHTHMRRQTTRLMTIHISRSTFRLPPRFRTSLSLAYVNVLLCVKAFCCNVYGSRSLLTLQVNICTFFSHLTYVSFTSFLLNLSYIWWSHLVLALVGILAYSILHHVHQIGRLLMTNKLINKWDGFSALTFTLRMLHRLSR